MDGNPDPIGSPPQGLTPTTPPAPRAKTLKCSKCGNPLTVRGLEHTEAIACEACGSILDLSDENLRILSTYQSKVKHKPLIPLGARGTLKGELLEVIGYVRRAITVEGVSYEWSEYLLFNPTRGFRWVTEYNGHWNLVQTIHDNPKMKGEGPGSTASYLNQTFRHFQTANARVSYVLGEFYWKVQVGETCQVTDYIAPPLILSREKTGKEVTWAAGEYMEPDTIWKAFRLNTAIPPKEGVAPNQPSPYAGVPSGIFKMFLAFLGAAFLIHLLLSILAQNKIVYEKYFTFRQQEQEKAQVTDFFELTGRTSNVVIKSTARVNNNWLYLHMALIREDGQAYHFGRELSYYHGTDGGEKWSEGNSSDEAALPAIPPGKYYLLIEPESSAQSISYGVQVYRDVPQWSFLLLAIGGLILIPIWVKWRSSRFEARRWAESDSSNSGDGDDSE